MCVNGDKALSLYLFCSKSTSITSFKVCNQLKIYERLEDNYIILFFNCLIHILQIKTRDGSAFYNPTALKEIHRL